MYGRHSLHASTSFTKTHIPPKSVNFRQPSSCVKELGTDRRCLVYKDGDRSAQPHCSRLVSSSVGAFLVLLCLPAFFGWLIIPPFIVLRHLQPKGRCACFIRDALQSSVNIAMLIYLVLCLNYQWGQTRCFWQVSVKSPSSTFLDPFLPFFTLIIHFFLFFLPSSFSSFLFFSFFFRD